MVVGQVVRHARRALLDLLRQAGHLVHARRDRVRHRLAAPRGLREDQRDDRRRGDRGRGQAPRLYGQACLEEGRDDPRRAPRSTSSWRSSIFAADLLDRDPDRHADHLRAERQHRLGGPAAPACSRGTAWPWNGVAGQGRRPSGCAPQLQSGSDGEHGALTVERDGETIERTARLQVLEDALTGDPLTNPDTGRPLTGLGFIFDAVGARRCASGRSKGSARGWDFTWYIVKTNVEVDRRRLHQQPGPRPGVEHRRRRAPRSTRSPTTG